MSIRVGKTIVIRELPDSKCEECGAVEECRPYGRGGKSICYGCGQKIPDIVEHNMGVQLFGDKGELR